MSRRCAPFEMSMADALMPMWREASIAEQRAWLLGRVLPEHAVTVVLEGERIVGFVASNAESMKQLHVRVGCHGRAIGREPMCRATAFGFEPVWQLDDVRYGWRRR